MEQKVAKKSKYRAWSVYVFIERHVQDGRSVKRRKRLTDQIPDQYVFTESAKSILHKFLYINVTKMEKIDNILYIEVEKGKKKKVHMHEIKDITSLQVREYRRDGRIE